MAGSPQTYVPIAAPSPKPKLVPKQHITGPPMHPLKRLETFSADEFEELVEEWAFGYLTPKYFQVVRTGGAGDKGRDIIGFTGEPSSDAPRDVFQCKFYDHPLTPTDIWVELGKLCYYCFIGQNKVPRHYYFISLKGVGAKLQAYLENPLKLKNDLLSEWAKQCEKQITKEKDIPLSDPLLKYIQAFDFSILRHKTPLELVEEHSKTKYHALRFGGLSLKPLVDEPVPTDIQPTETRYVEQLFEAYEDYTKGSLSHADLEHHPKLKKHFDRSRQSFYQAEALRVLSRDASTDGCEFDKLQEDIHNAVIDIAEADHDHGYARVVATTGKSLDVSLDSHVLGESVRTRHRHGICHQLANEDKLTWVPK